MSIQDSKTKGPLFYPCGNKVHLPHVGSDMTDYKVKKVSPPRFPTKQGSRTTLGPVGKDFVKNIADLDFSEDVVRDRCFHMLPYSDKYFHEALDTSDIIPPPPVKSRNRHSFSGGRYNARGEDKRHMPCHIQKISSHRLKPMKRKILQRSLADHTASKENRDDAPPEHQVIDSCFLTEVKAAQQRASEWDEVLMSRLSGNTAHWLVKQQMVPGRQQVRLCSLLEGWYGPSDNHSELVRDTVSEHSFIMTEEQKTETKKKWKKNNDTLLDKVREISKSQKKTTDPYDDESNAAFYRLPAGFRRARKHQEKEEAGAINTTAHDIEVEPYVPPPPPTLRDHLNPAIQERYHKTDNAFEQEWLTGRGQVRPDDNDPDKIVLDNQNKYRKVLQTEMPANPENWFSPKESQGMLDQAARPTSKKYQRGLRRWKDLPVPIDDTAEKLRLMAPSDSHVIRPTDGNGRGNNGNSNNLLVEIVNDWRSRWHLDMRYIDATPDDLIRDMADLHPHIRLKAITTCARAAEYSPNPKADGIQLSETAQKSDHVKLLPENLFVALECCLEDEHENVRRAAAITMYTLERPIPKAELILREALSDPRALDRWTASQCLAYYGECDSDVVGELVWQLLHASDPYRNQQAGTLLARLSENSTLVHSMVAEQLNSSSWRHRVMACQVLTGLSGNINKDLVNKLSHLMWNDWHNEVRKVAAQTLGKTGHGRDVHDTLRQRITEGNERERMEAVSKIGHLGIMTAKLLPIYLQCFEDSYVSVRKEACIAATNLKISDEQVLQHLINLATYDPIWTIKALAIQALGVIGTVTDAVKECVLWAFRYEDQAGVRAEACHTVYRLNLKTDEVAQMLQDRYLVEGSHLVKDEIIRALEMFDICPTEDMDMVAQIKGEVRKLCTRNNICAHIAENETNEKQQENMKRMIYNPQPEQKSRPVTANDDQMVSRWLTKHHLHTLEPPGDARTSRPVSRDTALTITADREVEAILDRQDTITSYSDDDSVSTTSHSKRSTKVEVKEEKDRVPSKMSFKAPKSPMTQIRELDEPEGTPGMSGGESKQSKSTVDSDTKWRDKMADGDTTYVEVGISREVTVDMTSDVQRLRHPDTAEPRSASHPGTAESRPRTHPGTAESRPRTHASTMEPRPLSDHAEGNEESAIPESSEGEGTPLARPESPGDDKEHHSAANDNATQKDAASGTDPESECDAGEGIPPPDSLHETVQEASEAEKTEEESLGGSTSSDDSD